MSPREEEVDALARTIDRIVFAESGGAGHTSEPQAGATALISYLNDSFPRVVAALARRERLERRISRALGIPRGPSNAGLNRLEAEMNRRLGNFDPRWAPVVGGTALVLLGVVGLAVWRQRGGVRPAIVSPR